MKHTHVPSMVMGTKYMLNKCYRNQNQIEVDIWEARAIFKHKYGSHHSFAQTF